MKILNLIRLWLLEDRATGALDYEAFLGWESLRERSMKKEEECLQRKQF